MTGTKRAVLIFVRAPERGRVKTRLAAEIGADAALRVYVRLAEQTLAAARALEPAEAQVRVHYTPVEAGEAVRRWLGAGAEYLPQAVGDLGERMRAACEQAFRAGFRRVLLIGSDLPQMHAGLLRRAFQALEQHEVVLGPTHDGGYYLLGLREPRPALFQDIPWSTERVLDCTLQRLRATGTAPVLLDTHRDVDRAADLPPELRVRECEVRQCVREHLRTP